MTGDQAPNPVITNLRVLRQSSDRFVDACRAVNVTLENTAGRPGLHPTKTGGFAHVHISAANLDRLTVAIWEAM